MPKIIITESQLKSLLLIEQTEDLFKKAQQGWQTYGAPNPKTGHNKYSDLQIQSLERQKMKGDLGGWKPSDDPAFYSDETGGLSLGHQERLKNVQDFEKTKSEINKPYYDALEFNDLVDKQKTLIPQFCKPKSNTYYDTITDGDNPKSESEYKKQDDRMSKGGWKLYRRGKLKSKNDPNYQWKSIYIKSKTVSAFDYCDDNEAQGVFVWPVGGNQKGYFCGCINPKTHNRNIVDDTNATTMIGALKINQQIADQNIKGFWEGLSDWVNECSDDYHCILDILSIAALAIPGYGPIVSMGLDFANASAYGIEAATSKTGEEMFANILAGSLTALGGFAGSGVGVTRRLVGEASRNPKIYEYASDALKQAKKEFKGIESIKSVTDKTKLHKMFEDIAEKHGLSVAEAKVGNRIIKEFSKIDPTIAKKYTDVLSKIHKTIDGGGNIAASNLRKFYKRKDFQNLLLKNNGDVIKSIQTYMVNKAGKEALIELGLFALLTKAFEIPEVQEWIQKSANWIKYAGKTNVKSLVEKEGYDWETVKLDFGAISTSHPNYSKEQSIKDNTLLKKAWKAGWRPGDEIPAEYQTDIYKNKKLKEKLSDETDYTEIEKSLSDEQKAQLEKEKEKMRQEKLDSMRQILSKDSDSIDVELDEKYKDLNLDLSLDLEGE